MGYFHTPRNKRSEVLRLMGNVLGLDRDEVGEVGQRSLLLITYISFYPPFCIHFFLMYSSSQMQMVHVPLDSHSVNIVMSNFSKRRSSLLHFFSFPPPFCLTLVEKFL